MDAMTMESPTSRLSGPEWEDRRLRDPRAWRRFEDFLNTHYVQNSELHIVWAAYVTGWQGHANVSEFQ